MTKDGASEEQQFARDVRAAMRWLYELMDRAEKNPNIGEVYAAEQNDPTISDWLDEASNALVDVDLLCIASGWIEDPEVMDEAGPK